MSDGQVALIVGHVVLGIWLRRPVPVVSLGALWLLTRRRWAVVLVAVAGGLVGVVLSNASWNGAHPRHLGRYAGRACLIADPAPQSGAIAAVFTMGGQRFETWARGSAARRLRDHLAGECADVDGRRRELGPNEAHRAAIRHVVGAFDVAVVGDWDHGTVISRATNRVRRLFATGAAVLRPPDDALFGGLVIGDDRNESAAIVDQFRASGLSHLTAVSGQNLAFVIGAASPVLRRLRPWLRWLTTVGLIVWFAALTRFEPSVLRAGFMAVIAATGFVMGREKPPERVLALAVGMLVLIDPMLVWSVGFWLSVGATAGVVLLATRLAAVLPGPRWLAVPAAVSLAAQIGIAPISLLVFGTLPIVSIPANLLAVPVAGFVMLYGLPAGLVAGGVGGAPAHVIQMPSAVGTRWVATVAALGSRMEPPGPWAAIGWCVVLGSVAALAISRRLRRPSDVRTPR